MSYVEPEWAHKPSHEWILTEIKGGIEVHKYHLQDRATTILGRALDMVHIPLNHESASRQHARISFDSQGIPWLRDLKSTHGTRVNKRQLPPQVCGKTESSSNKPGSRGIMVFPGDLFKFGASTRLFTLDGPPEFERGAMKAKLEQAATNGSTTSSNTIRGESVAKQPGEESKQDEGVSWGMSIDDENDDGDNGPASISKTLPMDMQVPEKHRKAFDRLNTMKYKLSNLESEDSRIKRKADLTSGQEKQLHRNAEREEALKRSINQLEEELYNKLYPEKANVPKSKQTEYIQDDGVDDFFDRTKEEKEDVIEEEESEDSLVEKWKRLWNLQTEERTNSLVPAEKKVQETQKKLSILEAQNDEDAFYVQNDLTLAKETRDKALAKQECTLDNMKEIEKLLKIVNPKLQVDLESGYIGEGPPSPKEDTLFTAPAPIKIMMPPPPRQLPSMASPTIADSDFMAMPPPVLPPPRIRGPNSPISPEKKRKVSNNMDMPPPVMPPTTMPPPVVKAPAMPAPKRARVVGPAMKPPTTSVDETKKKASPKKPMGTLAFLDAMTKDNINTGSNGQKGDKDRQQQNAKKKGVLDPKKDVWRAPEGQDGSGYTKLNAKFAGRY
ncbi:MAG: hypothetical protein SGBAC_010887 [Bacillariaceae sp.]